MAIVAKWKLTSAGILVDSSGNGHTLADNVGTTGNTAGFQGGANTAALFNTASQGLYATNGSALRPASFTLSAWVKPTSLTAGSNYWIAGMYGASGTYSFALYLHSNTNNNALVRAVISFNGTSVTFFANASEQAALNTWLHVVFVHDSATGSTLYVNGASSATDSTTGSPYASAANFVIGNTAAYSSRFIGSIDDVLLDNTAYTSTDVTALYTTNEDFTIPPVTGTISSIESRDVSAISAGIKNIATIGSSESRDTTAISGAAHNPTTGTISSTESADVTVINAQKNSPVAQISSVESRDVTAVAASLKNIADITSTEAADATQITAFRTITGAISSTEHRDVSVVLAAASAVTEPIFVQVRHKTTGAAITGLTTVNLTIFKPATGQWWDFATNTFTTSPATATLSLALTEVSTSYLRGRYSALVTTTNWSDWITFEATYDDGVFVYSYSGEAYYSGGVRASGSWSAVELAAVAAVKADTAQLLVNVDGLPSSVENRVEMDSNSTKLANLNAPISGVAAAVVAAIDAALMSDGLTYAQSKIVNDAILHGKVTGAGTATESFWSVNQANVLVERVRFTSDASGNRTNVVFINVDP